VARLGVLVGAVVGALAVADGGNSTQASGILVSGVR
jgi:hypothetical protein